MLVTTHFEIQMVSLILLVILWTSSYAIQLTFPRKRETSCEVSLGEVASGIWGRWSWWPHVQMWLSSHWLCWQGAVLYVSNSQDMVVPCPLFLCPITERVMYNIGAWCFLTILVSLHHIIQVQGLSYFLPVSLMENDGKWSSLKSKLRHKSGCWCRFDFRDLVEEEYKSSKNNIPGTLNNQFLMDVWWNNHFPSKGLVHHPTETSILKGMFRVPRIYNGQTMSNSLVVYIFEMFEPMGATHPIHPVLIQNVALGGDIRFILLLHHDANQKAPVKWDRLLLNGCRIETPTVNKA